MLAEWINIFAHTALHEERILRHKRDLAANCMKTKFSDVGTIDTNLATILITESEKRLQD